MTLSNSMLMTLHGRLHDVAIYCIKAAQLASLSSFSLSTLANSRVLLRSFTEGADGSAMEAQVYFCNGFAGRQPLLNNQLHRSLHFLLIASNQPLDEYNRQLLCMSYAAMINLRTVQRLVSIFDITSIHAEVYQQSAEAVEFHPCANGWNQHLSPPPLQAQE